MTSQVTCDVTRPSGLYLRTIPAIVDGFKRCTAEERSNVNFVRGYITAFLVNAHLLAPIFEWTEKTQPSYTHDDIFAIVSALFSVVDESMHQSLHIDHMFDYLSFDSRNIHENMLHHRYVGMSDTPANYGFVAGLAVIYSFFLEPIEPEPPLALTDDYELTGPDLMLSYDVVIPHCTPHCPYNHSRYGSISLRMPSDSILMCGIYRFGERAFCIAFTRITPGNWETLGMLKVDIREGVDINTCSMGFRCEIRCENAPFYRTLDIVPVVDTRRVKFDRNDCWQMLCHIGRTLDEGGRFVAAHCNYFGSTLRVINSDGKYVATISASIDNHDDDMAGVIMGYAEAWITTSDTHTQIRSVELIKPVIQALDEYEEEDDHSTLNLSVMRLRPHRVLAKTLRTAEANQPYVSPVRLAWVCSVMRSTNTRPTPSKF